MIKKIGFGVGIFLFLLVAAVAVLPFVIDVNKFKEPIIKKVEEQINGRVELQKISLKLFPFIGLKLEGLSVRNLPNTSFGETPIVSLGEMDFRIHLKSILQQKIVASLLLKAPQIQIIKTGEKSNLDSLLKESKKEEKEEKPAELPNVEKETKGLIKDVVVEKITIRDGLFVYDDQTTAGPPTKISGFRLDITNAVLTDTTQPIGIDLGLRLFDAPEENISFKGNVAANLETKSAELKEAQLLIAGSPIAFEATIEDYEKKQKISAKMDASITMSSLYSLMPEAKKSLPAGSSLTGTMKFSFSANGTPQQMALKLLFDLKEAAIEYGEAFEKSAGSGLSLTASGNYSTQLENSSLDGSLTFEKIRYEKYVLTNFESGFSYAKKIALLKNLKFTLFEGAFSGSGSVDRTAEKPRFDFSLHANRMNMDQALTAAASLPNFITGYGSTDISLKGAGIDEKEIKKSLTGTIDLALEDGEIKAFNIAPGIFTSDLLGSMTSVAAKLPATHLAGFNLSAPAAVNAGKGTPFNKLATHLTVDEGKIHIPNIDLTHQSNFIQVEGTVDLDQNLDLKGRYFLSKEATENWITDAKLRSYLVDNEGQFIVPFKMTGKAMDPLITPDPSYTKELMTRAVTRLIEEEAKKKATEVIQQQVAPKVEEKAKETINKLKKLF